MISKLLLNCQSSALFGISTELIKEKVLNSSHEKWLFLGRWKAKQFFQKSLYQFGKLAQEELE
jgi:hypothetical protein